MEKNREVKIDDLIGELDIEDIVAQIMSERGVSKAPIYEGVIATNFQQEGVDYQVGPEDQTKEISVVADLSSSFLNGAKKSWRRARSNVTTHDIQKEIKTIEEQIADVETQILQHKNVTGFVAMSNSSGGVGKTTLSAYLALYDQLLFPGWSICAADTHDQTGSNRFRLLEEDEVFTLEDLVKHASPENDSGGVLTHSRLANLVARHESGLSVIPNVRVQKRENKDKRSHFEIAMKTLDDMYSRFYVDRGNSIDTFSHVVPLTMARHIIFPCLADNLESIDRIAGSDIPHFMADEPMIANRLDKSTVVVLGAKEEDTQGYVDLIAESYPEGRDYPGKVITIPYDPWMSTKARNNISIDMIDPEAQLALGKVLLRTLSAV